VRFPFLLIILLTSTLAFAANPSAPNHSAPTPEQGRSRLLELFIWKTSEELKLPTDVEAKFDEIIRSLNERRKANNERMEKAIARLNELTRVPEALQTPAAETSPSEGAAVTSTPAPAPLAAKPLTSKPSKEVDAALSEYKKALQEFQKLQTDELTQLKAILTPEKLAKYLVVKNELTEKLKTFLSKPNEPAASPAPGTKEPKPLGTPKVIEEK
jgi:hypothetical protein